MKIKTVLVTTLGLGLMFAPAASLSSTASAGQAGPETASAAPPAGPPASGQPTDPAKAERALRANAKGSVSFSAEPATHRVGFIAAGRNGDLLPDSRARATDKASAFLARYGALLGVTDVGQVRQT